MKSQKAELFENSKSLRFSSRVLVVILLLLAACFPIYPGQAMQKPEQPVYYPRQIPQAPVKIEPPIIVSTPALQPTPTPNKECRKECGSTLQSCRGKSQPPFSACVDKARTAMKNCLAAGDDSYCRFEYSKSRTICFDSFMAGCDILFNTCVSKC